MAGLEGAEISPPPTRIQTPTVQAVASHYTGYAMLATMRVTLSESPPVRLIRYVRKWQGECGNKGRLEANTEEVWCPGYYAVKDNTLAASREWWDNSKFMVLNEERAT